MAKTSQIDRIVAEMRAEKLIVEDCITRVDNGVKLEDYAAMLETCIERLLNGASPIVPKPTRTRKSRKATEPAST